MSLSESKIESLTALVEKGLASNYTFEAYDTSEEATESDAITCLTESDKADFVAALVALESAKLIITDGNYSFLEVIPEMTDDNVEQSLLLLSGCIPEVVDAVEEAEETTEETTEEAAETESSEDGEASELSDSSSDTE